MSPRSSTPVVWHVVEPVAVHSPPGLPILAADLVRPGEEERRDRALVGDEARRAPARAHSRWAFDLEAKDDRDEAGTHRRKGCMRIAVASDHAGFRYKELVRAALAGQGHEVRDFGTHSTEPVDYPEFIRPAAEAVARGEGRSEER